MNIKKTTPKECIKIPNSYETQLQNIFNRYLSELNPQDKKTIENIIEECVDRTKNALSRYISSQLPIIVENLTTSKMNAEMESIKQVFITEIREQVFSMVITEEKVSQMFQTLEEEISKTFETNIKEIIDDFKKELKEQRDKDIIEINKYKDDFQKQINFLQEQISGLQDVIADIYLDDIIPSLDYIVEDIDDLTVMLTIINADSYDSIEIEFGE